MASLPATTRLRYVRARTPEVLTKFCDALSGRIEIKHIVKDGAHWFLWFVPDDKGRDIQSGEIVIVKQNNKELIGYVRSSK